MAYTTLVAGTTITAAWANASVRDQGVSPFASAAARSSSITSPVEGMVTHLNDTNMLGVYSGAAWSHTGPMHGTPPTWLPVITQGATPTFTNNRSVYTRLGRWVMGSFHCTITGTPGTAANNIIITLPVTAAGGLIFGVGRVSDVSASQEFAAMMAFNTSTNFLLQVMTLALPAGYLGTTSFTAALASGDIVTGNFSYEAAADA